jgi:hypothetical protein
LKFYRRAIRIYCPDGRPFLTTIELTCYAEQQAVLAQQERLRADQQQELGQQERLRGDRLAAKLQALGIDSDELA